MEPKTLPCPFCGGKAKKESPYKDEHSVGCDDRDCMGFVERTIAYTTMKSAIEAWNTRHPSPIVSRVTEKIIDFINDTLSGIKYLEEQEQDYGFGKERLREKAQAILSLLKQKEI